MRWPLRRSSSAGSRVGPEQDTNAQAEPQTPDDQTPVVPGRRDLPGIEPALGTMPTVSDAGFSRSLPTRWRTPPALGALGHDVRTDVPGGLVSGVARTVDPRDARPADLVWRMPDISGLSTPAAANVAAAAPVNAASTSPTSTSSMRPSRPPTTASSTGIASTGTPAPEAAPAPHAPASPQSSIPSQTSVSPGDASADTAQTRQAPLDADVAVEARDPRPVPADVTDGQTAATPVPGVTIGPVSETLESPPSTSTTGPRALVNPREARPGPDPLGSALAVAPLVSRAALPRVTAQPLTGAAGAAPLPAPSSMPAPTPTVDSTERNDPPAQLGSAPELAREAPTSPIMESPTTPDAPEPTAATTSVPTSASAQTTVTENAPTTDAANLTPEAVSAEPTTTSPITPTVPTEPTTPDSPPQAPASPTTSRVAPLVSATRFVPVAASISVLQAPTAPVDQPVRAAKSIVGSYVGAFANAPAVNAATVNVPSVNAPSAPSAGALAQVASQAAAASAPPALAALAPRSAVQQAVRGSSGVIAPATNAISGGTPTQSVVNQALSAATTTTTTTAASTHTAAAAVNDHAVLDTLARQLYGRFSRHLAGELLIDRERAQFLTDLT